jgi:hypothetical protein
MGYKVLNLIFGGVLVAFIPIFFSSLIIKLVTGDWELQRNLSKGEVILIGVSILITSIIEFINSNNYRSNQKTSHLFLVYFSLILVAVSLAAFLAISISIEPLMPLKYPLSQQDRFTTSIYLFSLLSLSSLVCISLSDR